MMSATGGDSAARTARGMTVSTLQRLLVAGPAGIVAGLVAGFAWNWRYGLLAGWMVAALLFVGWTLLTIWPLGPAETARHALRDDPGRTTLDLLVLLAAVASLGAVAILLLEQATNSGLDSVLSVASVVLAWVTVHTVYTTRYAGLYYASPAGGIGFNEDDPPQYSDFVYLAFTIGMTFQVSDTDFTTKDIRKAALRHALLSYLFGAVILAGTINLIAGLAH
jgi:uncharacterized membrane protein